MQPLQRKFLHVGILPCIRRQQIKEWGGGIQGFQIEAAPVNNNKHMMKEAKLMFGRKLTITRNGT